MAGFIDKIAVVTGGGSGIGRTICSYLAERDARVVAADRNLEAVEETAALIRSTGGSAESRRVDVIDPGDDLRLPGCLSYHEEAGGLHSSKRNESIGSHTIRKTSMFRRLLAGSLAAIPPGQNLCQAYRERRGAECCRGQLYSLVPRAFHGRDLVPLGRQAPHRNIPESYELEIWHRQGERGIVSTVELTLVRPMNPRLPRRRHR